MDVDVLSIDTRLATAIDDTQEAATATALGTQVAATATALDTMVDGSVLKQKKIWPAGPRGPASVRPHWAGGDETSHGTPPRYVGVPQTPVGPPGFSHALSEYAGLATAPAQTDPQTCEAICRPPKKQKVQIEEGADLDSQIEGAD